MAPQAEWWLRLRHRGMETLANAAYMSSPDQTYSSAFGHSDLHSMAVMGMGARHGGLGAGCMSQCMPPNVMAAAMPGMPSMGSHGLMPAQHLHGPGRHLQILDHTVHRIDAQRKPNGEQDNEMVVSNLRHFTLKVGVLDPHQGIGREADLPLKAELLYENGQPVRVTILRGRAGIPHLYLSPLLRRQDRSPLVAACPACARAYTLLSPGLAVAGRTAGDLRAAACGENRGDRYAGLGHVQTTHHIALEPPRQAAFPHPRKPAGHGPAGPRAWACGRDDADEMRHEADAPLVGRDEARVDRGSGWGGG